MGLGETSLKWRAALFLQVLGFVLGIAAVSSTYMAAAEVIPNRELHLGFWDKCDDMQTFGCMDMIEYLNSIREGSEWVHGCRAMAVIGLILEGFTILAALYLAYMTSGMHIGNLITGIGSFLSIIVILIGAIVFLVNALLTLEAELEMDAYPSWSFAVFMIGQAFFLIAGCTQIYEACTAQ